MDGPGEKQYFQWMRPLHPIAGREKLAGAEKRRRRGRDAFPLYCNQPPGLRLVDRAIGRFYREFQGLMVIPATFSMV
jgi:hypothetical protein